MTKKRLFGMIIGLTAYGLAWFMYDWKLALILILTMSANNIEQNRK